MKKISSLVKYFEDQQIQNIVLWSGGQDSTLMMYALCQAMVNKNPNHTRDIVIKYFYFHSSQIGKNKMRREKLARERITAILEYNFKGVKLSPTKIDMDSLPYIDIGNTHQKKAQTAMWAVTSFFIPDKSKLNIGIIKSGEKTFDGETVTFVEIQKSIYEALARLCGKAETTVQYPLIKYSRKEVTKLLTDIDLLKLTTWCESTGKKDNCGECTPCKSHKL